MRPARIVVECVSGNIIKLVASDRNSQMKFLAEESLEVSVIPALQPAIEVAPIVLISDERLPLQRIDLAA